MGDDEEVVWNLNGERFKERSSEACLLKNSKFRSRRNGEFLDAIVRGARGQVRGERQHDYTYE